MGAFLIQMSAAFGLLPMLTASSTVSGLRSTSRAAASIASAERNRWMVANRSGIRRGFSATAAPGAIILIPDPSNVPEWLQQNDYWKPSISGTWRPDTITLSCNGRTALTVGTWRSEEDHGYYATVWVRAGREWRWSYHFDDRDDEGSAKLSRVPKFQRASCRKANPKLVPAHVGEANFDEKYGSSDHTLEWAWWNVRSHYHLAVYRWDGIRYQTLIQKEIAHDYE